MIVRVILWALLAYVLWRVVGRVVKSVFLGMGYQPPGGPVGSVGLVRDPVCGTFVAPARAISSGSGSNTRYFCSEKCRQDYARRP